MLKKSIFIFIAFLFLPIIAQAEASTTLESYTANFYNRYSQQFDENGLKYAVPDYGITEFKDATTPRELMSLVSFYRFRAVNGEVKAQAIIRDAISQSDVLLAKKTTKNFSFEDAAAQFLIWQMLDEVPLNLSFAEIKNYKHKILARAEENLAAPDTENRAVLSAVYWQAIVNQALVEKAMTISNKEKVEKIIKNKIEVVIANCIDQDNWYVEGTPKKLNPHYHLVTAFSLMVYGDLTNNQTYKDLAKKMTENLRTISFAGGMVEARIGNRPVGLGAQFYLGAGLLNWYYGFEDYGTYLSFASGDKFFSDPEYPNRLEYHATRLGEEANFHDDYAFSNLAELANNVAFFQAKEIVFSSKLATANNDELVYKDKKIILQADKQTTKIVAKKTVKAFKISEENDLGFEIGENKTFFLDKLYNVLLKLSPWQ